MCICWRCWGMAESTMKWVSFSACMKLKSYSIMDAAALQVLSFSGDRKLAGGENANKTSSGTNNSILLNTQWKSYSLANLQLILVYCNVRTDSCTAVSVQDHIKWPKEEITLRHLRKRGLWLSPKGHNSVKVLTFRKTFWALFQIVGSRLCERHIMSFLSRHCPFIDLPTFQAISKGYTAMTIPHPPPPKKNKKNRNMYSTTSTSSTNDTFICI